MGISRRASPSPRDSRGRPRDYNHVARHRDLLETSVELAVPKIEEGLDAAEVGAPLWQITGPLRKAIHYLTVGRTMRSGRSDKYGQVYVERIGSTGFDDPTEPVALLRAQDEKALGVMEGYLCELEADPRVPDEQVMSVRRQVEKFRQWRADHPERVRVPGTRRN